MAAPVTKTDTAQRAGKSGLGNSITAGGTLTGNLSVKGPLILGALVKGDVESDDLILVEATGGIEGRVRAATLIIHGSVKGDVEASTTLEVCSGGRLEGVAFSPSMRVEERSFVSADLLIAPARSVAHINKSAAVPDLSNVAPLTAPKAEEAGDALEAVAS
jgi:cytoskeletal protein CcmA (bactofilin family)